MTGQNPRKKIFCRTCRKGPFWLNGIQHRYNHSKCEIITASEHIDEQLWEWLPKDSRRIHGADCGVLSPADGPNHGEIHGNGKKTRFTQDPGTSNRLWTELDTGQSFIEGRIRPDDGTGGGIRNPAMQQVFQACVAYAGEGNPAVCCPECEAWVPLAWYGKKCQCCGYKVRVRKRGGRK